MKKGIQINYGQVKATQSHLHRLVTTEVTQTGRGHRQTFLEAGTISQGLAVFAAKTYVAREQQMLETLATDLTALMQYLQSATERFAQTDSSYANNTQIPDPIPPN